MTMGRRTALEWAWHLVAAAVIVFAPAVVLGRPTWSGSRGDVVAVVSVAVGYLLTAIGLTWLRGRDRLRWPESAGLSVSVFGGVVLFVLLQPEAFSRRALLFGLAVAGVFLAPFGPRPFRAALAAGGAAVLVLLVALDVTIQAQILTLITDLVKQLGLSVLLITHNLGVVAKTCEKAAVMYAGRVIEQAPVRELFRNPKHPYTRGLIQAVPTKQTLRGGLEGIPGSIPTLTDPPSGCRFHPRCLQVMDVCRSEVPPPTPIGPDHQTSCHLYPEAT